MAGEIYLSNLSGQFDYQAILDKYEQLKLEQVNLIQSKEFKVQQAKSAFKSYASMLEEFKNSFEEIADGTFFDQKKIAISNDQTASVSIIDDTLVEPTQLDFTVTALAKNDVWLSQAGVASTSDAVATTDGTLTIQVGDTSVDVNYTADDTLSTIAQKINDADAGVTASLFFDGTNYRLLVSSQNSGTESAISFLDSGDLLDNLALGDNYADSHVQTAQNATIDIYGTTVESQSNSFENLINGVNITVYETSLDPVHISIEQDKEAIVQKIEDLFSLYNSLVDYEKEKSGQDGELSGDFTMHSIRSTIFNTFTPFMEQGLISVDHTNGHISLDKSKLDSLIDSDPDVLKSMIADVNDSLTPYLDSLFDTDGLINEKDKNYDRQIQKYEDSIDATVERLNLEMERLKKQFIHLDGLMAQLNDVKLRIASLLPADQQQ